MRCNRLLAGRANRRDLHVRRSPPDRDIVNPFDRDVFQSQVFQLRSNGTYASSLPKAGSDATMQATGLEYAVRWTATEKH